MLLFASYWYAAALLLAPPSSNFPFSKLKYPPNILVIRLSALGDIAMTVPVVRQLAMQYPEVNITMLSKPFVKPLFQDMPHNVHFMAADFNGEHKGISGLNKLFRRLHAKHFTHVADLHDVLRTKYLRLRFNINKYHVAHIDKHRKQRRQILKHNSIPQPLSQHDNYADVFEKLGYPINEPNVAVPNEKQHHTNSPDNSHSSLHSPLSSFLIGIAPFAAHKGKIYPAQKMENVIRLLSQQPDIQQICLFCGKGEETDIVNTWCKRYEKCTNASQQLGSLEKEIQFMRSLHVMLSMDSANAHLAALAGIPVLTIWGATHPIMGFQAYKQPDTNNIQVEMECRPCSVYGNKACSKGDYPCLNNIKEETIVQHILQHLANNNKQT